MPIIPKRTDPEGARALRRVHLRRGQEYASMAAASAAIAKQVGVGSETVRRWRVQAQIDAGKWAGMTSEESGEITRTRHWLSPSTVL